MNPLQAWILLCVGGLVNLRTALPFDYPGFKGSVTVQEGYTKLNGKKKPSASGPSVARVVEPRVVAVVVLRHVDPPRNRDDVHDPRQNAFIPVRGSGITFWCRWSSRI